jgi:putative transcriptional regulator
MKDTRVTVDPKDVRTFPRGRVDPERVDNTTEDEIARHKAEDEAEPLQEMAAYVRRIRHRLEMTQTRFAREMGVSLDTLRNWEQGRRYPTGAAKALLRILDREPEAALSALRDD